MSHTFDIEKRKRASIKVLTFTPGPSLTIGSAADETDINKIVARFNRTGEMPADRRAHAQYGDISSIQQKDATTAISDARATIQQVRSDVLTHRQKQIQIQKQKQHDELVEQIKKDLLNPPEPKPPASGS